MGRRKRIPYDPPHLRKGKKGRPPTTPARVEQMAMSRRMLFARGTVVAAFSVLAAKLGFMQVVEGEKYRTEAASNIRRSETVPATRGLIFDRKGRELAINEQTWEVRVLPGELPDDAAEQQRIFDTLINALDLPEALVLDPLDVPEGAAQTVYTRTAQLLGKVLTIETTDQTASYPFFKTQAQILRADGQELQIFVYPDIQSRKSDWARISSDGRLVAGKEVNWPDRPNFSAQGNILALLLSSDSRLANRVERAIGTLPADKATSYDQVVTTLREDALTAWTSYIEQEASQNYLVRLDDDLTTDQAALCRAHLNELPGVSVMNQLQYLVANGRYQEKVVVRTGVPRDVALKLEANKLYLPGVELDGGVLIRRYPGGGAFSHVLGYVGKVSARDLDNPTNKDAFGHPLYEPEDYIGKDGLELTLEPMLRGARGKQIVEMDPGGSDWRVVPGTAISPQQGRNATLTIDLEFQRAVAEILALGIKYSNDDRQALAALDPTRNFKKASGAGAVVAIDPKTGEVLAMVSYPHYDNQLFVDGISQRKYQEYISDEANKPLLDRALRGEYPPGSTLKPFEAVSALQDKKITTGKTYYCAGAIQVPYAWDESKGNTHPCWAWRLGGHQDLDVYGGIEQSCDVFFYNVGAPRQPIDESKTDYLHYRDKDMQTGQLGEKHYFEGLGIQAIKKYLTEHFWFGQATGIDLPTEALGTVPDAEWLARTYQGAGWSVGDTINVAIGQGYFLATPLQMAMNVASIANSGSVRKPLVVKETFDDARTSVSASQPVEYRKLGFAKENLDVAREGMRRVVHGDNGTARFNVDGSSKWALTNPPGEPEITIGGKTGTAELGLPDDNGVYEQQHAWFTCFAPFDDPEIAVAVIVEDGGEGSAYAVPVADRVLRAWFEVSGKRARGAVLRAGADPTNTEQSLLADSAAFPKPGAGGAAVPLGQD
ncbi:MAG TPA: penicillin-binding transpeptidase domain-containing protein [Thermomicrobiales bacterium]|nr:penicillin-binding transpeptidase domain-containing protein [Thermomicrobiales bacterium]